MSAVFAPMVEALFDGPFSLSTDPTYYPVEGGSYTVRMIERKTNGRGDGFGPVDYVIEQDVYEVPVADMESEPQQNDCFYIGEQKFTVKSHDQIMDDLVYRLIADKA